MRETCAWLVEETGQRPWQEVLPPLAAAAEAMFPYDEEDAHLRELLEYRTR